MHGIVRLPDINRAFFELERAPNNQDFILDNSTFTKMACNPDELLLNGDLEMGHSMYWDTWGGDVVLEVVDGYGGTGSALKASGRTHYSHGMAQILNTDCVEGGKPFPFEMPVIPIRVPGLNQCIFPFYFVQREIVLHSMGESSSRAEARRTIAMSHRGVATGARMFLCTQRSLESTRYVIISSLLHCCG